MDKAMNHPPISPLKGEGQVDFRPEKRHNQILPVMRNSKIYEFFHIFIIFFEKCKLLYYLKNKNINSPS